MVQMVQVTKASYRGQEVEGIFELVQGYTPFKGDARRNGRNGSGFIKVVTKGLPGAASAMTKLTVEGEGVGYTVTTDDELVLEMNEMVSAASTFTMVPALDIEAFLEA